MHYQQPSSSVVVSLIQDNLRPLEAERKNASVKISADNENDLSIEFNRFNLRVLKLLVGLIDNSLFINKLLR